MYRSINTTLNRRSGAAASGNTETRQATVTSAVAASDGSVAYVNLRVPGQSNDMQRVLNTSGIKLAVGDQVTINFVNGSRHRAQVIGASGAGTAASVVSGSDADSSSSDPPQLPSDLQTSPVVLQTASLTAPQGFVETAGPNIALTPTAPTFNSDGSVASAGVQLLAALLVRVTSLPDPTTTTLPIGTIYELSDSSGNSQGLYRLEAGSPNTWHQIVTGAGRGNDIFVGTVSPPAAQTGQQNGDLYINSSNGDLYSLVSGTWTKQGNLTGPAGAQGSPGAAATVAVGTTTTGAAGSSASVTNSGTTSAATLNFTIPQGAQGIQGNPGHTPQTTTSASLTTAAGSQTISVVDGTAFGVNQTIVLNNGSSNAHFLITARTATSLTATLASQTGDSATGTVFASGSNVSVAGLQGATGATGSSGTGTAGANGHTPQTSLTVQLTVSSGSQTLSVADGTAFSAGQTIVVAGTANSNVAHFTVTAASSTAITATYAPQGGDVAVGGVFATGSPVGVSGTQGHSPLTYCNASGVTCTQGASTSIPAADTTAFTPGMTIALFNNASPPTQTAHFLLTAVSSTTLTGTCQLQTGDVATNTFIPPGGYISVAGLQGATGAAGAGGTGSSLAVKDLAGGATTSGVTEIDFAGTNTVSGTKITHAPVLVATSFNANLPAGSIRLNTNATAGSVSYPTSARYVTVATTLSALKPYIVGDTTNGTLQMTIPDASSTDFPIFFIGATGTGGQPITVVAAGNGATSTIYNNSSISQGSTAIYTKLYNDSTGAIMGWWKQTL